jgi:hypothetical protein
MSDPIIEQQGAGAEWSDLDAVYALVSAITAEIFGLEIGFIVSLDKTHPNGRIYLQCSYEAPCTVTGEVKEWHSRKWYLSQHMTEDEIVKTAFAAFKATVEHEVMEGFRFDGDRVFNPHASFRALIEAGKNHVFRAADSTIKEGQ